MLSILAVGLQERTLLSAVVEQHFSWGLNLAALSAQLCGLLAGLCMLGAAMQRIWHLALISFVLLVAEGSLCVYLIVKAAMTDGKSLTKTGYSLTVVFALSLSLSPTH